MKNNRPKRKQLITVITSPAPVHRHREKLEAAFQIEKVTEREGADARPITISSAVLGWTFCPPETGTARNAALRPITGTLDDRVVASEKTDSTRTADRIAASWRESGLEVTVAETNTQ